MVLRFGTIVGDDGADPLLAARRRHGRRIGLGHPSDWAHVIHTDDLGRRCWPRCTPRAASTTSAPSRCSASTWSQGYADAAGVESGAFIGSFGRWVLGPRLSR